MSTNGNSFVTAFQIDSIKPWSPLNPNVESNFLSDYLNLEMSSTPESSKFGYEIQTKFQITSLGKIPKEIAESMLQRLLFHFLIEIIPISAFKELQDSMLQIYDYYIESTPSRFQLPPPLPPIKAKLAEPKQSEIIPLAD